MSICATCRHDNPDGSKFCNSCGAPFEPAPAVEGERKLATVLFADVAGSTALAQRVGAEDWAAIMNGAFAFMNAAVARYGGTVSRLMGDAILALFGAPVAHEDDAERAVRAGLDIVRAANEYATRLRARYGIDFGVRVGINTGVAVLARMGTQVHSEYTAMGNTANLAARLQSAAAVGTVLITTGTYRLVRPLFEVRPVGALELKGAEAPVEAFEIVRAKPAPTKTRGIEGLVSPIVGRDAELDRLRRALDAVRSGRGFVVAIVGEAGLGKSRLVREIEIEATRSEPPPVWAEGRAVSFGQTLIYHLWQQIGRRLIGATQNDGPSIVRQRLRESAHRLGLGESDRDLSVYETMLAVDAVDAAGGEPRATAAAKPQAAAAAQASLIADQLRGYLRASMRAGASMTPHVLVFDDLHWADTASIDLLAAVTPLVRTEPLLLLAVLRPDHAAASWSLLDRLADAAGDRFARIDLELLRAEHADTLLRNLLFVEDLPERVRATLLARAEGNPFFLEELLRSLIDAGHIVYEDGHWRATRSITGVEMPETLAGVLTARIDRLPELTKRVAQTAAVIGRTFAAPPLEDVCRAAPAGERVEDVSPHLEVLSVEELIRARAEQPEREYSFKHALTQQAAYDLLLSQRRRVLHALVGSALERLYPDRVEELTATLARHFQLGGEPVRAAGYALRAGNRALKLFALAEALEHFDAAARALEEIDDPPLDLLCDAIMGWTWVRYKQDRYDGVLGRLERAVEAARALDDKQRLARALTWIGNVHMLTGFPSRSVPYLMEAGEIAAELGDDQMLVVHRFFATQGLLERDPRQAAEQLAVTIELARESDMPEVEAHALAAKAGVHARLGEYDEADANIARALEAAPRAGSVVKEADVYIEVGAAYREMGETEKGIEYARRGAELASSVSAKECASAGYCTVGDGELDRSALDDATAHYHRSLQLADGAGLGGLEGWVNRIHAGIAAADFERGHAAALADLEATLRNARANKDDFVAAELALRLASAYGRLGRPADALPLLEATAAYAERTGMRPFLARALDEMAAAYDALARPNDARLARDRAGALRVTFRSDAPAAAAAGTTAPGARPESPLTVSP